MTSSISYEKAVELVKQNNKMKSEYPDTYPHIIDSSLAYEAGERGEMVTYLVDNGQTTQESGWVYEVDHPGK